MQAELIEAMHRQVQTIHRALEVVGRPQTDAPSNSAPPSPESDEIITRRRRRGGAGDRGVQRAP
jgi:hypothetical protein